MGLDKDAVAVFEPEGAEFGLLPGEMLDFGIKIEGEKAVIMAGKIVFWTGVAEADDEFHEIIITDYWAVK